MVRRGGLYTRQIPISQIRPLSSTVHSTGLSQHPPTVERVYVIFFMIIGVTAFAFVVGNMSALVQQMDTTAKARQEKTEQINQWIQFRKFPKELQIQIRDHFHYLWSRKSMFFDESSILSDLPLSLRTSVALALNEQILHNIPFFKNLPPEVITAIITRLQAYTCGPGDFIVKEGQIGRAMYILSRGKVQVLSGMGDRCINTWEMEATLESLLLLARMQRELP
eukprot:05678_1